jgi:hypothetical protein
MKSIATLFLLVVLSGCHPNEMEYSRKRLVEYESNGYSIVINKTKTIKIKDLFLDKRAIRKIEINKERKVINLKRKDTILNRVNLSTIADNSKPLENQLILIDGIAVESNDFETTAIEASAVKNVRVISDSVGNFRRYDKVYIFKTYDND